ncbi:hypothetical protein BAUCODRAFT_29747 [Baudoinia panamericana UAMH 10762]|uniref:LysM domain-containing protein n=1 Tax=Baudoinia panamericana (strain UAMH 10762) TaxID=717646 RepID=M2NP28_BAUPA|nr:uncharacterized protein BAUCODRAFT_29747 [Baudoinia panamericana UAMH 10762]EMD01305.1 hypothetical protein BAUCODRAFT_29747 [Baudoinia panamericana UAMH 10762]
MVRTSNASRLVAFSLCAALATAQTSTQPASSSTSAPPSSTTPLPTLTAAANASTTTDMPMTIWDIANSLLSSYYPSTTLTQIDTLTWPATVVVGSSTYSVQPESTSTPTTSSVASKSPGNSAQSGPKLGGDEKIGVAVGAAVGAVAVAVLAVVLCCMYRRRKATGSFFLRRPTPSVTGSDIEAWRSPIDRHSSVRSNGPSSLWAERYDRLSDEPSGHLQPPPMAMHPAFARQYSQQSLSEKNPFFTPEERSHEHFELDGAGVATKPSHEPIEQHAERGARPPTPFSPMLQVDTTTSHEASRIVNENPFASEEDEEANDLVSPIVPPARSPERRYSPMVHYPSWSEVSEFDFSGEGRRSTRNTSSNEDVSDGWHPRRESVIGRHELD